MKKPPKNRVYSAYFDMFPDNFEEDPLMHSESDLSELLPESLAYMTIVTR